LRRAGPPWGSGFRPRTGSRNVAISWRLSRNRPVSHSEDRLDLAEAAIARQLDVEVQIEAATRAEAEAGAAERRLEESAAELRLRRGQMYAELRSFEESQRAASAGEDGSGLPGSGLQRRAERAQAAFERAMDAAGGLGGGRASPEAAAKVAELEALQKEAAIAERLAALRGAAGESAQPAASAGKRARTGARP
jgi:phage shock protein A